MKELSSPRLFIVGDSWGVNFFAEPEWIKNLKGESKWKDRPYHVVEYLTQHYEVHNFCRGAAGNTEIVFQLGRLPDFKAGDRLIVILSAFPRFRLWDCEGKVIKFGDFSSAFLDSSDHPWHPSSTVLEALEGRRRLFADALMHGSLEKLLSRFSQDFVYDHWSELAFFGKLKNFFSNYRPIICCWERHLAGFCNLDYIGSDSEIYQGQPATIEQEYGYNDHHLGGIGNYLLYKYFLNRLDNPASPTDQRTH